MVRLVGAKVKIEHGGVESRRGKVLNDAMRTMKHILFSTVLFAALVVLAGLAMPVKPLAETGVSDLRTQIRDLAAAHGFIINGLERIGDDAATPVSGDLRHQIERLLEKYNFVLLHDADGSILEVRISQPIQAAPKFPNRYAIKTARKGQHHVVERN